MAKAKLSDMAERWIAGKDEKRHDVKTVRQDTVTTEGKAKLTVYVPKQAMKMLWYNRAETGESLSVAVGKLIMERFRHTGKK